MNNLFDFRKEFLKVQAGVRSRQPEGRFNTFPFTLYVQRTGVDHSYFAILDTSLRVHGDNCIWRVGKARHVQDIVRFVGSEIRDWLNRHGERYCLEAHVIRRSVVRMPPHGAVKRLVQGGEAPEKAHLLMDGALANAESLTLRLADEKTTYARELGETFTQQEIGFRYIERYAKAAA